MSSVQTPSPRTQPLPKLAEARAVTLRDHVLNIFRLVIKELRSIRSDPTMLILVVYAFSISVNTVATGAVTEATNLGRQQGSRVEWCDRCNAFHVDGWKTDLMEVEPFQS